MKLIEQNRNKILKILLILIILLSITIFVRTFGRYIYNEIRDFYLASHSFYFNSDKLSVAMNNEELDNYSGVDPYTITINLNSYKNNFVASSSDITYTISYTCSENATCELSKTEGIIYTASHTDAFYVTITPKENLSDKESIWVEITATATSPYQKTLRGKFTLTVGKMGLTYAINDVKNRAYFDISFTNTYDFYTINEAFQNYNIGDRIDINTYLNLSDDDKKKCSSAVIEIKFDPSIVILDMTNELYLNAINSTTKKINNKDYINGLTFTIEALSSNTIRFYKSDVTKDYTYPFGTSSPIITVIFH